MLETRSTRPNGGDSLPYESLYQRRKFLSEKWPIGPGPRAKKADYIFPIEHIAKNDNLTNLYTGKKCETSEYTKA